MIAMNIEILSIGDVTTDAFIDLSKAFIWHSGGIQKLCMSFGDKIPYKDLQIIDGVGNAANAAVCASRLGVRSVLYTFVGGDDFGQKAITRWKENGVNTDFVKMHDELQTHFHFVLRFGAERTILIKHEKWPYDISDIKTLKPKWIYLTSIGEHTEYFHEQLSSFLQENEDIKLAFQPGTFQISLLAQGKLSKLFARSDIFICNTQEAMLILNTQEQNPVKLLQKMAKKTKNPIVTDGPNGVYFVFENSMYHLPAYPDLKPPVDRTGAGDAFSATTISFLAKDSNLKEAIVYGPINSMSIVQYVGAQSGLLSTVEIEELLKSAPDEYKLKKII